MYGERVHATNEKPSIRREERGEEIREVFVHTCVVRGDEARLAFAIARRLAPAAQSAPKPPPLTAPP
jgi:hypothetical protein